VSLAYQQGLYRLDTRTRIRVLLLGDGASILAGAARTEGTHQTEFSRLLNAPTRWSYAKIGFYFLAASLAWLIIYAHIVMASPPPVSSTPGELSGVLLVALFIALLSAVWRHNHSVYQRALARWDRLFVCLRCGAINE